MAEKDKNYDLISVLYHALNGLETCDTYIEDAKGSEDEEMTKFFHETQKQYAQMAKRAKELLAKQL